MLGKLWPRQLSQSLKDLTKPEDIARSLKVRFGLKFLEIEKLKKLTDLSEPTKAFPFTRAMKRKIICHLGPTNSGKTYAAIEELKRQAKAGGGGEFGVYCAPLRLLAQEMYEKLNGSGVDCALRTGEISKLPKLKNSGSIDDSNIYESFDWNVAPVVSCTVEMLNMRKVYSVAVIDEIQMIADPQRGWAFTQALLGCNAERLYLCGEVAAKPLIEKILRETGETVEFVSFERLTPLQLVVPSKKSTSYEAGDCIVTFSRKSIFKLKEEIEFRSKQKVAVVYGALPAENRSLQAAKFNETGSGVDILVASDAIGMGLNLNIRRIIFERLTKFDGNGIVPVPAQQIRQIAGRAGRFNTKHEVGLVTCEKMEDFKILEAALNDLEPKPYEQAGISPLFTQIEAIRQEFPNFHLADILDSFCAFPSLPPHYFLTEMRSVRKLLEILRGMDLGGVELEELFLFLSAPVKVENEEVASTFLYVNELCLFTHTIIYFSLLSF